VQLHPGTSSPPSDAARKFDTAQRYIFKILNMLKTLKQKINLMQYISRTLYLSNKTISRPPQSREAIYLRGQT
jgi:hypothetical protein